jgi:hypothetical protein
VLIVLYSTLFFYIRIQSKKLRDAESSSHQSAGEQGGYEMASGLVYKSVTKHLPATPEHHLQVRRVQSRLNASDRRLKKVSLTLLCYPLVYIVFLMPLSIARLRQFAGLNPSLTFTYAAAAVFDCKGFVNVILYSSTRKGLIPWDFFVRKLTRRIPQDEPKTFNPSSDNRLHTKLPSRDSVISMASLNCPPPVPEKSDKIDLDDQILDCGSSCDERTGSSC